MMEFALLAPGPSMSPAVADGLRGRRVGVVNNCFELAPWADFLAANDIRWWAANPAAKEFSGKRFTTNRIEGVERVTGDMMRPNLNSGVLALECAKQLGATRIRLYGFDMRGSHYFGKYTNGLGNTTTGRRKVHQLQYAKWAAKNKEVQVINCTPGSALTCFPFND